MDKVKVIREECDNTKQIFNLEQYSENLFDDKGYLYGIRSNMFRTFQKKLLPSDIFNFNECGFFYLACGLFLNGDDNILCTIENKNIVPISIEKIMNTFDLKRRTAFSYLKKFVENNVFREITIKNPNGTETSFMLVNPLYVMRPKRISLLLFITFQDELKMALPDYALEKFEEMMENLENKPMFKNRKNKIKE